MSDPAKNKAHTTPSSLMQRFAATLILAALCLCASQITAEEAEHGDATSPAQDDGSINEPSAAVRAPRTVENFTEPGVTQNPIAIDFDPQGNLYVVEAWRAGIAVIDNRNAGLRRSNGVIDDLKKTSVEDRLKQIEMLEEKGYYPKGIFTDTADKIRVLRDTDGDGKADKTHLFADNFNDKLDGIASGVLWHQGKVYLTNIPHLWLLEDKDGDGDADKNTPGERTSLSYGYGIRWAFYGHDMHGLIKGPDGRIYFSIGDRGYNVTNQEGEQLYGPDRGAVFRMWPDGSELEVFHQGLRNPQELAFDNYGNLFTGDNNCDAGDLARFVHVLEGGHSGWNQDVQSLWPHRGPWLRERMWEPRLGKDDPTQPAWIVHPIANVGRGPSGLAHYPGTGDAFAPNGSFLLCDYPPGVRHVQLAPKGASFKVTEDSVFTGDDTITDIAWGYDGRLYLADWGGGWKPNPNGNIKTMVNPAAHQKQAEAIAEVESLFANGFDKLEDDKLIELLGHQDQRVRLNAQWALAERPFTSTKLGMILTQDLGTELTRLHAVWALSMQARKEPGIASEIAYALDDKSPRVQAQALSVLGDLGEADTPTYTAMLEYDSPIVRFHAAIALGKTTGVAGIEPLLDLLERNDDNDQAIRHAAVYGLSLIGDADEITHYALQRKSAAARLAAVLALRRLKSPDVALFLDDSDTLVAVEAVRAIYDMQIVDKFPELAALLDTLPEDRMIEPVLRRVFEANIRLAGKDSAARLARFAANQKAPEDWRITALDELDRWSNKRDREGVWGHWWPREDQPFEDALAAMKTHLPDIIKQAPGPVATRARVLSLQRLESPTPDQLAAIATNADEPADLRLYALRTLSRSDKQQAIDLAAAAARSLDSSAQMRNDLRDLLMNWDVDKAMDSYLFALREGEVLERQQAVRKLGRMKSQQATELLASLAIELGRGQLDPAIRLDVFKATENNQKLPANARAAVQRYAEANRLPDEGPFIRDTVLVGGSVQNGKDVFLNNSVAECLRCHTVNGKGSVGPDLSAIGSMHDVAYLYNALVKPHADIAQGYATTTVTLKNGSVQSGRVITARSTPATLMLANSDGVEIPIARDQIQGVPVTSDQSLMPTMTDRLNDYELRDVLAYLVSLKASASQSAAMSTGPRIIAVASNIPHHIVLPLFLLANFVLMGAILLVTVLSSSSPEVAHA